MELVISLTPHLYRLPKKPHVAVSLDLALPLELIRERQTGSPILKNENLFGVDEHTLLQERVDALSSQLTSRLVTSPTAHESSFVFSMMFSPVEAWRILVRKALKLVCPTVVHLPCLPQSAMRVSCRNELLLLAACRVAWEESVTYSQQEYYANFQTFPVTFARSRLPRALDDVADYVSAAFTLTRKEIERTRFERYVSNSATFPCLLIGSNRHVIELQRFRDPRISVSTIHDAAGFLERNYYTPRMPIQFSAADDSATIVEKYLQQIVFASDLEAPAIERLANSPLQVLLTDHEHDPRVRLLVRLLLDRGKRVGLLPEGATHGTSKMWPFMRDWYCLDDRAHRFALGDQEVQNFHENGVKSRTIVSGYFGRMDPALYEETLPFRASRWLRRRNDRPTVMIAMDGNLGDIGLTVPGLLWPQTYVRAYDILVRSLADAGYHVLVRARDARIVPILRDVWGELGVDFSVFAHWTSCLSVADVVVSEQSSVAIQALRLGCPVVVYRFSNLPAFSDSYRAIKADYFRYVEEGGDVVSAVSSVLSAAPRTGVEFDGTLALRREVVLDWLTDQCQTSFPA